MKTVVVTDSTAYLPEETREALNIHMISLQVMFDDRSFKESELGQKNFYQKAKEEFPKTSQPPPG